MLPVVQVRDLNISFVQEGSTSVAVNNISFDIPAGKITAVIGESGSGKSVTALSFMQLLPQNSVISGELLYTEKSSPPVNLALLPEKEIRKYRGSKIAMIFQEPMTSLNPVHTCGAQVMEALMLHKKLSKAQARERTVELFTKVELPLPARMLSRYPHQISGGQKQRVMIAMAMSCDPALLIADEPTTALDVRVQKNILVLLKKLQQETGMAILFISHDLSLVADIADSIIVMYKGGVVEKGDAVSVLKSPSHPYTKALLACKPSAASKGKRLPVVTEIMAGTVMNELPGTVVPSNIQHDIVLQVENLVVAYPSKKNIFGKTTAEFRAVDNVSFTVKRNEVIGLVGESGCGKTTLGRAILQLVKSSSGKIYFEGKDISAYSAADLRILRKNIQIVFQDPYGSLNPRLSVGEAIMEPMKVHFPALRKNERKEKTIELLEQVDMPAEAFNRHPHSFSGGQRQRICIARALALNPDFLIFDESVSALDVSVQAQVLNLINDLKAAYNFTAVFISHDLAVVHYLSDRILVMNAGRIVEEGPANEVFTSPKEAYTRELLEAIPGGIPFKVGNL